MISVARLLNVFAFVKIFVVLLFSILYAKQSNSFTALFGDHDIGLERIKSSIDLDPQRNRCSQRKILCLWTYCITLTESAFDNTKTRTNEHQRNISSAILD